jgi:hypothetical protein
VKEKKNVRIYRRDVPGKDVPKVKGVGVVEYSANAVMTLLWDIQRKKEYDPFFRSGRELQLIDEQTSVVYQEFEKQLFVSGRDFVNVSSYCRFRDGSFALAARSVEHDAQPRDKNHVRGGTSDVDLLCCVVFCFGPLRIYVFWLISCLACLFLVCRDLHRRLHHPSCAGLRNHALCGDVHSARRPQRLAALFSGELCVQ